MQIFTFREIIKRLGISPNDLVRYSQKGGKGFIEVELKPLSLAKTGNPRVDVAEDPVFKMEGYESDAPADSSINLDEHLYGQDYPA